MVVERSPARKPVGGDKRPPTQKPPSPAAAAAPPASTAPAADDDIDWIISGKEPVRASDMISRPWMSPAGSSATHSQPSSQGIEFGKPSPLAPTSYKNLFNVPKSNRPRPEFHRPNKSNTSRYRPPFQPPAPPPPAQPYGAASDPDVVEIPRPAQASFWQDGLPRGPMLYSSQPAQTQRIDVDLTDPALAYDRFGAPGVYDYVDQEKATQDIKALLEGAFEDEEDKPKPGKKEKKVSDADAVTAKLANASLEATTEAESEPDGEDDVDDGSVEGLKVRLLPHQVEGVSWMHDKETGTRKIKGARPKGGILADDMGLGKTVQSIALMLTNPRPPKHNFTGGKEDKNKLSNTVGHGTLVVAPLALIKQWESEIDTKVSDSHRLRVLVHHGPTRTKRSDDLKKYDVVITTYQILVSERNNCTDKVQYGCFGVHWYRIFLDEAHTIKNRKAKATQACSALEAEYRWCLTGTPMQNNLEELQSLIAFLRIKPYDDLAVWRQQIQQPMNAGRGGVAMRRLQYYLKAFMKRRTKNILKKEGALDPGGKARAEKGGQTAFKITERVVEKLEIDFSPKERLFYERLEARADRSIEQMVSDANMSYASALTLLLRLRQACNHPQLVLKAKNKDKDALAIEQITEHTSSPRASVADVDDLADAFGALDMQSTKCDVCQIKLSAEEKANRQVRCAECQADLDDQSQHTSKTHKPKKKKKKIGKDKRTGPIRRERHRRVIDESDDDDEGEWIVPENQQIRIQNGRAGDSDDENAEGGGEWLNAEDSETGDEDSIQILGSHRKKGAKAETESDEDETISSDESETSESDLDEHSGGETSPTASTKIRELLKILRRESGTHKFIVFSVFTSMLDLIEPALKKDGLVFTRYDGSMRNDLREASLDRLRNDRRTRIMLCSLKCGSLGLNLTAASRVVILEPFWNPFVEEQAIDRVHRLNQTIDVTVYRLTIRNSVEERIFDLQEKKRKLAEAAIEGKSLVKLSMQDILNLFKHDHHGKEEAGDGRNDKLGEKTRVLHGGPGPTEARKSRPAEHSVFGRRW